MLSYYNNLGQHRDRLTESVSFGIMNPCMQTQQQRPGTILKIDGDSTQMGT